MTIPTHPHPTILTRFYCALCVTPALSPATPLTAQCTLTPYILPPPPLMWSTQLLCYSCPTSYYPLLLWLPADGRMPPGSSGASESAGWYSGQASGCCCSSRERIDGWSPFEAALVEATTPRKAASQSPTPACPAHHTRQNNQRVTAYKTRKDGRCSTQCVGDSPVERRGGAGYVGLFCAGSGGR